jgi:hypothetical protein
MLRNVFELRSLRLSIPGVIEHKVKEPDHHLLVTDPERTIGIQHNSLRTDWNSFPTWSSISKAIT